MPPTAPAGRRLPRRRLLLASVLAAVLVAGGAWWLGRDDESAPAPDWSALPVVPPVVPPAVTDDISDEDAAAALAQIDPCALAADGVKGGDRLFSETSMGCLITRDGIEYGGAVELDVPVVARLRGFERFNLGGFVAWRTPRGNPAGCDIAVPAGTRAQLYFSSTADDDCVALIERAAQVVRRLVAHPHALDLTQPRPTPCQFIVAGRLGSLLAGCEGTDRRDVRFEFSDARHYRDDTPIRIAGTDAIESRRLVKVERFAPDEARCSVRWTTRWKQARLSYGNGEPASQRPFDALVMAEDCQVARTVAARLARGERAWTPPALPTRPLLQPYDAPSVITGTGACQFLAEQAARACAPSVVREVSDDPIQRLRRGEADPDVICTAALEVVRTYDPAFEAVSARPTATSGNDRACSLVRPASTVEIRIKASRDDLEYKPEVQVAGHDAFHHPDWGLWAVALDAADEPGSLEVSLNSDDPVDWYDDFVDALVRRVL